MVHAYVYVKDGNRFIFPGHWYDDDDPDVGLGSAARCIIEGMMFGVVLGLKHYGWIDIDMDENGHGTIEHLPYEMHGPQFRHGHCRLYLIGGPLMDAHFMHAMLGETVP